MKVCLSVSKAYPMLPMLSIFLASFTGTRFLNTFFSVEIVPICCGDLIFLPRNIAASFGPNIGSIVICTRVAKTFTLLDPFTLTHCFLKARQYFHAPFLPSFSRPHLVEYVVLGIDESEVEEKKKLKFGDSVDKDEDSDPYAYAAVNDAAAKKYRLANAVVTPVKHNGSIFPIKTHLGRILKPGDHALGYDLLAAGVGPILITKISYAKEENGRVVAVKDKWESDYQLFLKDLQQDPQLLFNRRAIYRNPTNCHPSGLLLRSPFYRPFYPFEDLLHG